jgi:putative transposase
VTRACGAVGLKRATYYRAIKPKQDEDAGALEKEACSHRRLSDEQRRALLAAMNTEEFIDQPPREVYAALLSRGESLCSWRTMYRVLGEQGPVRDRRDQRKPRSFAIPRLEATAPNMVWTWDISKLPTYAPGVFLNLYVVLDLFSRYVVGWMIAAHENSALAKQLFEEAIVRYGLVASELVVHHDRGAPMTSHTFKDLLADLGINQSMSRPRVSNDNAFSEAHFRTAKYQPDYPGRFADIDGARAWFQDFFEWYNDQHHHEGLALFTPGQVFRGEVADVAAVRQRALDGAYASHPERFVKGRPTVALPPAQVRINPADAAPPSAEELLATADENLAELWPAKNNERVPCINLPGAAQPQPAALPS